MPRAIQKPGSRAAGGGWRKRQRLAINVLDRAARGETQQAIARAMKVSQPTVSRILGAARPTLIHTGAVVNGAAHPPDAAPGSINRERGAYYTPDALALAIAASLAAAIGRPRWIMEPGCGGGAFLRAARATWPDAEMCGVDMVPACDGPGTILRGDLFALRDPAWDLILGNPDFAHAEEIVRHCYGLLRPGGTLAFLLRATFLSSDRRVAFHKAHPLRLLQPVAQRPAFLGEGTTSDPTEYAVFVWQEGWTGRAELLPGLNWRASGRRAKQGDRR